MSNYLVTGCLGFIGSAVSEALLKRGDRVIGVDYLVDTSSVRDVPKSTLILKKHRLENLLTMKGFDFGELDIRLETSCRMIFANPVEYDAVLHFAAATGIRDSIENPELYYSTNVDGSLGILKHAVLNDVPKVLLASTSSVYGDVPSLEIGLCEGRVTAPLMPISPYAATKLAMEVMAYTYHHLYELNILIPRYFTVYQCGRPDMAIPLFIHQISQGKKIRVYGDGTQRRDFTYIDDAVAATLRILDFEANTKFYQIFNVASGESVSLNKVIDLIAENVGRPEPTEVYYAEKQQGDVHSTWGNISKAKRLLDWEPKVGIEEGIKLSVEWYRENEDWLKECF